MKVYVEMEGTNPRTGSPDVAYIAVEVDDSVIRAAQKPVEMVMDDLREHIAGLLTLCGVEV